MSRTNTSPDGVMRVAHLTTVDLSLRFLLWPQLRAVVDSGAEAFGISSPGPWVAEVEEAGVTHIALESSTRGVSVLSDFKAAVEFWRALRRTRLTVLHTHNPKPGIYGRILGRLAGVPVVVNTLHGFYATETDPFLKRAIVYGLEAVAARFSDAELHQNVEDLALAKRLHIVRKSNARLLGNGIDLSRFDPSKIAPGVRERIRLELGATDGQVIVGTVGRLVAEKGFPELFEAAEQLGDDVVLAVIGPVDPDKPDALPPEMIARAEAAGVRFLGMRKDMEDLYSAMDIFVLPSHREGFPRAAMEAAAMGLPVVATDIRGCRQVVTDGVTGLLVPVRQPGPLRDALRRLAEDPELRSAMSEASRKVAREEFDERRVVRIVMETYQEVLTAKGLAHLMAPGMLADQGAVRIREATTDDARDIAGLHVDLITSGFLPLLGRRFMRVMYRALLGWRGARVFVAEDTGGVVGFTAGIDRVGPFYRWFARARWLPAGLAAVPALLRPANLRRAAENFRYGRGHESAEVLALAVAPRARGQAVSTRLLEHLLGALESDGVHSVRAVVGSSHPAAVSTYVKVGFEPGGTVEVHRGEVSQLLIRRLG